MRICLIAGEIFAWGKHGGFGRATRTIGAYLAKRGHEVLAVVPLRGTQGPLETLDGIRVLGFPRYALWRLPRLFRECDADVYHSQEPSTATWLALRAMPDRRHVITFRDPRDATDWRVELRYPSRGRAAALLNRLYESNPLVRQAVLRADARFAASRHASAKAVACFALRQPPPLLPPRRDATAAGQGVRANRLLRLSLGSAQETRDLLRSEFRVS